MTEPRFDELSFATPTREGLAASYAHLHATLDAGKVAEALAAWDKLRRDYESWASLVHLRFSQDTTDAEAKAAREYSDALAPEATGHEVALKRRLLALPDSAAVAAATGTHALRLWEMDITTFDPAIAADLEEESRLTARYTELLAAAELRIDGRTINLAGLAPYAEDPDRAKRHQAEALRWGFFATHGEALDGIFGELVALRHGMARKLGYANYIPLGYRRMRRTDYDAADVARYRDQVAEHVVPLVARLLEARRKAQGWDRLHYWDEALIDPAGNPKPIGDHDVLVAQAQVMFDRMDPCCGAR